MCFRNGPTSYVVISRLRCCEVFQTNKLSRLIDASSSLSHSFFLSLTSDACSVIFQTQSCASSVCISQNIFTAKFMVPTVRESQGIQKYHGAKVNKDAEKNRTVACTLHTAVQNFFCSLRSQIIYTFSFVLPPLFLVLLQVIESQHWYFA